MSSVTNICTLGKGSNNPDLTPCNFWVFPEIKKALCGVRFEWNQHVIEAVEAQCKELSKNGLSLVFQKQQEWWTKCIVLEGVILKRIMYILSRRWEEEGCWFVEFAYS